MRVPPCADSASACGVHEGRLPARSVGAGAFVAREFIRRVSSGGVRVKAEVKISYSCLNRLKYLQAFTQSCLHLYLN